MKAFWIDQHESTAIDDPADTFVAYSIAAAQAGDIGAYFDLGLALSTGSNGQARDIVEAFKWFDIAATLDHVESLLCREDLAQMMTAAEISEGERRSHEWLSQTVSKAA